MRSKYLLLLVGLWLGAHQHLTAQCGLASTQFTNYLNNGGSTPQGNEVLVLVNQAGSNTSTFLISVPAGHTYVYDLNINAVTSLVFFNNCHSASLSDCPGFGAAGSICTQTWSCDNDLHFYFPPGQISPSCTQVTVTLTPVAGPPGDAVQIIINLSSQVIGVDQTQPTKKPALVLSPNPCDEQCRLQFEHAKAGNATVQIRNSYGALLQTVCAGRFFTAGTQQMTLDLSGQPPGLYAVCVLTDSGTETSYLVKI